MRRSQHRGARGLPQESNLKSVVGTLLLVLVVLLLVFSLLGTEPSSSSELSDDAYTRFLKDHLSPIVGTAGEGGSGGTWNRGGEPAGDVASPLPDCEHTLATYMEPSDNGWGGKMEEEEMIKWNGLFLSPFHLHRNKREKELAYICSRREGNLKTRQEIMRNFRRSVEEDAYYKIRGGSDALKAKCGAVFFSHVVKTGGTTYRDYLKRLSSNGCWNTITYSQWPHFSAPGLFALNERTPPKVAIEMHGKYNDGLMVPDLYDAIREMRDMWQPRGCKISLVSMVRDPIHLAISAYTYFGQKPVIHSYKNNPSRLVGRIDVQPIESMEQASVSGFLLNTMGKGMNTMQLYHYVPELLAGGVSGAKIPGEDWYAVYSPTVGIISSLKSNRTPAQQEEFERIVLQRLDEYDFIGVYEDHDPSYVLLTMEAGLPLTPFLIKGHTNKAKGNVLDDDVVYYRLPGKPTKAQLYEEVYGDPEIWAQIQELWADEFWFYEVVKERYSRLVEEEKARGLLELVATVRQQSRLVDYQTDRRVDRVGRESHAIRPHSSLFACGSNCTINLLSPSEYKPEAMTMTWKNTEECSKCDNLYC